MLTFDTHRKHLKGWQYMFAGGASGATARALCQPLDVLKIRFQLQVEPIVSGSKYSSVPQAVRTIVQEEGIAAMWSGHIPAQYLSISYGIAQFWSYEVLTEKCYKAYTDPSNLYKPVINFTCGAIAGSFATIVSFPFDTVRTRIIAEDKNSRVYRSVWHTCHHMYTTEGRLSLFKGLFPTVAQIAPHSGAQFMFYKLFNEYFSMFNAGSTDKNQGSLLSSMSAGSIAGFLSKLCIYPFDLAKKRMQIQGFLHNRRRFGENFVCRGFIDCIIQTVKREGFVALYKGLLPSLIKATLVTSLHFTFFEQYCRLF